MALESCAHNYPSFHTVNERRVARSQRPRVDILALGEQIFHGVHRALLRGRVEGEVSVKAAWREEG